MGLRNIAPQVLHSGMRADGLGMQLHVQCLETGNYYFMSENTSYPECLLFPSTKNGGIESHTEVASRGSAHAMLRDWAEGKLRITDPPDCDSDFEE